MPISCRLGALLSKVIHLAASSLPWSQLYHAKVGTNVERVVKAESGLSIEVYVIKETTTIVESVVFYLVFVYPHLWYRIDNTVIDTKDLIASIGPNGVSSLYLKIVIG